MSINEQNSVGRITLPIIRRDINSDTSEDFTLPDYFPEIRKVLYARESMLTPAKFISGNKLDINGVIDYDLVYVSGDGRLCSAPLSAEYSFSLPLENMSEFEISEGFCIIAHSVAESSSVRVSAPRRLQIRSHIRTAVSAWGKMLCEEKITGLDEGESVERLEEIEEAVELVCENSDLVALQDEYRLPSTEHRIASAQSNVLIGGVRIEDDVASINGDILIKLLVICDATGESERVLRKIPFDAQTDLDGIDMSDKPLCTVNGNVTDLSIEVEDGNAHIEANLVLELCGVNRHSVSYTGDMYSTDRHCECTMKQCDIPVIICNKNLNLSQNERITIEELGFPETAEIVDINASAIADRVEIEDDVYIVRGNCKYNIIARKDGDYTSHEIRIPFKYDIEAENGAFDDIESSDIVVGVSGVRARLDGEYVSIDSDISLACSLWGKKSVQMLERAELGAPSDRRSGAIVVCYPVSDDTLWSIAKRYSVKRSGISGDPSTDSFVMIET